MTTHERCEIPPRSPTIVGSAVDDGLIERREQQHEHQRQEDQAQARLRLDRCVRHLRHTTYITQLLRLNHLDVT